MNEKITIKSFSAFDKPELTQKYIEGHQKVLELYGVTKVTSSKLQWVEDPNSIVVSVESGSGKILGGGRIQIASEIYPLPIEDAIGEMDNRIYQLIKEYTKFKTAEFCGLWNSREIAGYGIGSIFLARVGISLTDKLNLGSLFGLCSPATLNLSLNVGFTVMEVLGNKGTFYYPKEDLLATALFLPDPHLLHHANETDRKRILSLRKNPFQNATESGPKGTVDINYNLGI